MECKRQRKTLLSQNHTQIGQNQVVYADPQTKVEGHPTILPVQSACGQINGFSLQVFIVVADDDPDLVQIVDIARETVLIFRACETSQSCNEAASSIDLNV